MVILYIHFNSFFYDFIFRKYTVYAGKTFTHMSNTRNKLYRTNYINYKIRDRITFTINPSMKWVNVPRNGKTLP